MAVSLADRVDLLRKTVLLRNLRDPSALQELACQMDEVEFPPARVIVTKGEPGDALYVVVSGEAEVSVGGVTLSLLEPGAYFGEMALFAGGARTATVRTTRPTRCLRLDYTVFDAALAREPRLGTNLLRGLCRQLRALIGLAVAAHSAGDDDESMAVPADAGDRRALMRAIPLFADIDDERCLARLAAAMQERHYAAGEPIVRAGERSDRLHLLVEGHARVHVGDLTLAQLGSGAPIGELSLLDGEPHSASVTTLAPARGLSLGRGEVFAAMSQAPAIQRQIIGTLCRRIIACSRALAALDAGGAHPDAAGAAVRRFTPYLNLPAEPLLVQDEQTGGWGVPLTPTIAREFAAVAAPAAPEEADGFARALVVERDAFAELLARDPLDRDGWREQALPLAEGLYARLRTPIEPKKGYVALAEALRRVRAHPDGAVRLGGVLAGPTAARELPYFLDATDTFRRAGFRTRLHLLMVRWETLVAATDLAADARWDGWEAQVGAVGELLRQRGASHAELTTADVALDLRAGTIAAPAPFAQSHAEVLEAARDLRAAPPELSRDLLWITGFYARQESLGRLGVEQPLIDLAIRRAVGRHFDSLFSIGTRDLPVASAIMTSELNRRFVACYGSPVPAINIAVG